LEILRKREGLTVLRKISFALVALGLFLTKLRADKDYVAWIKSLDKIRTIVSDSIYREL
jgi:hypothetical protein